MKWLWRPIQAISTYEPYRQEAKSNVNQTLYPSFTIVPGKTPRYKVVRVIDSVRWLQEMFTRGKTERFPVIVDISNAYSPGLAAELWKYNTDNRNPSPAKVAVYLRDANLDVWTLTPEPVFLSWDEVVQNGQGRIETAMHATGSMVVTLWFGCEREEYHFVDQGRNRTVPQILKKERYPYSNIISTFATASLRLDPNPDSRQSLASIKEKADRAREIAARNCAITLPDVRRAKSEDSDPEKVTDFLAWCIQRGEDYTKDAVISKKTGKIQTPAGPGAMAKWVHLWVVQYSLFQCGLHLEACMKSNSAAEIDRDPDKLVNFANALVFTAEEGSRKRGISYIRKLNSILCDPINSVKINGWEERQLQTWQIACIENVFLHFPRSASMSEDQIIGNGFPPFYYR